MAEPDDRYPHCAISGPARDVSGRVVLRVRGEVDAATAPLLDRALRAAEHARGGDVIVDAAEMSFLDAAGLRVLAAAAAHLSERGRQLVLVDPGPLQRRLLAITGIGRWVTVEDRSNSHR